MEVMVIFDFDWSLINENTDTYIFDVLAPALVPELHSLRGTMQWTKLMDYLVKKMMIEYGVTKEALATCLRNIPYFREMLEAARLAKENGANLFIISDSNHFYTDEILQEHGIREIWSQIYTNKAEFDDRHVLSINPYLDFENGEAHRCSTCPQNMCKGNIMDSVIAAQGGRRVVKKIIYIGDGGGDFCPCKRLLEGDVICCREDWRLHKDLLQESSQYSRPVAATIMPWKSGSDVLRVFQSHFCN